MDLDTVNEVVAVRDRDDLPAWRAGDAVIAGGTWLLSEAQGELRRLIDITTMGWEPVTISDKGLQDDGLQLAATCSVERIAELAAELPQDWTAAPLLRQCCTALVASYKIWKTATIGGNLSLSFPAGGMISLVTALDGTLTVWRPDGSEYTVGICEFVTGNATNMLSQGELVRSVWLPAPALRGRTAYRKIALSKLGRSGAVLAGRRDLPSDGGGFALAVTGSTTRPLSLRFPDVPSRAELDAALGEIPEELWHEDAHGAADWRAAVSAVLAHEIREELQ